MVHYFPLALNLDCSAFISCALYFAFFFCASVQCPSGNYGYNEPTNVHDDDDIFFPTIINAVLCMQYTVSIMLNATMQYTPSL